MSLEEIEETTGTVEDFIEYCLNQDMEYDKFFEYLNNKHKG